MKKLIIFIIAIMLSIILTNNTPVNTFAGSNINVGNRKIVNIAVLLYSFDDLFMQQLKQGFENIQNENPNKVKFSFYDGKNNISIQNETLDSLVHNGFDLFIVDLADTRENAVEDVILKVRQSNVPLILKSIDPEVASKVSKYYDKVVFGSPNAEQSGIKEGEVITKLWNANKKAIDKNGDQMLQYILLEGRSGSTEARERSKFVISTINDAGIKTEKLARVNADWSKELAENSIKNLFLRYGSNIEAIISNNDAMAIGAIEALREYGYNKDDKSKYIPVVGIDAIPEARNLVDEGIMAGTVIQDLKALAEGLYNIGMNMVKKVSPIENTNYKYTNGEVLIPIAYEEYTNKVIN